MPFSPESVRRGKALYLSYCAECHDEDGKALSVTVAEAADLTAPDTWLYGTSDGELFVSIRDGAGDEMPPFKQVIRNEDNLWRVVNFVKSLGPRRKP